MSCTPINQLLVPSLETKYLHRATAYSECGGNSGERVFGPGIKH